MKDYRKISEEIIKSADGNVRRFINNNKDQICKKHKLSTSEFGHIRSLAASMAVSASPPPPAPEPKKSKPKKKKTKPKAESKPATTKSNKKKSSSSKKKK